MKLWKPFHTLLGASLLAAPSAFGQPIWDYIGASMPSNIVGHTVATPGDGKIYVIGQGTSSGVASKLVFRYNPLTDQVEDNTVVTSGVVPIAQLPNYRCDATAVVSWNGKPIYGRIWAIGGREGPGHPLATNSVVYYDVVTNTWTSGPPMNVARVKPAAAVGPDGKIYVFGGTDNFGNPIFTIESLDTQVTGATWTYVKDSSSNNLTITHTGLLRAAQVHDGSIVLTTASDQYVFQHAPPSILWLHDYTLPSGSDFTRGQDGNLYRVRSSENVFSDTAPPAFAPFNTSVMNQAHTQVEATAAEGALYVIDNSSEYYLPLNANVNSYARAFWRFNSSWGSSSPCTVTGALSTFAAPTFAPGRVAQAASFNGTTQALAYNSSTCTNVGTGSFSIDFWMNHQLPSTGTYTIQDNRQLNSAGKYQGYHVFLYNGQIGLQIATQTGSAPWGNYWSSTTKVPANEWVHVAMTVDRTSTSPKGYIWLNGVLSHSFTPVLGNLDSANSFKIGAHYNSASPKYKGLLDEFQIHDRTLTFPEVRSIFLAGAQGKQ